MAEAKLYPPSPGFLDRAMVEVELTNNTGQRLNRIIFQAGLRSAAEVAEFADSVVAVPEIFAYWLQAGRIDVGFLGAAQIDRFDQNVGALVEHLDKRGVLDNTLILFLTDNFPPEVNAPANRTFEHCREWVTRQSS